MYFQLLSLSLIVIIVSADPISYTECDTATNIGKLESLLIPGDPITVGKTNPVDLSLAGSINSPVTDDVDLVLKIDKQVSVLGIKKWISIPCIDGFGSCTQKLINYVTKYNETFVCDLLTKMGKPCSMPFQPGQYSVSNYLIQVNLSKIPQTILSLANGKIRVHIEIKNTDATLYCIDVIADLKLLSDNQQQSVDDLSSDDGGYWSEYNPFNE